MRITEKTKHYDKVTSRRKLKKYTKRMIIADLGGRYPMKRLKFSRIDFLMWIQMRKNVNRNAYKKD